VQESNVKLHHKWPCLGTVCLPGPGTFDVVLLGLTRAEAASLSALLCRNAAACAYGPCAQIPLRAPVPALLRHTF
jgi:hypothetical protein